MEKQPVRVGTVTLGATLFGVGIALLAHNLGKTPVGVELWRFWPVLPLMLGVEFLVRQHFSRGTEGATALRLDGVAVFLAVLALLAGIAYTAIPAGAASLRELVGFWHPYEYQTEVYQELTDLAGVQRFAVANRFGSVRIQGTDNNRIDVTATIRTTAPTPEEAEALSRGVAVKLTSGPEVRLEAPPLLGTVNGRNRRVVDYVIRVPKTLMTAVDVAFGSLELHDITASTIDFRNGSLQAERLRGDVVASGDFGSVTIREVFGSLTVGANHSQIDLEGVEGKLRLRNEFGSIKLREISGPLELVSSQGNVDVYTSKAPDGDWSLTTRFGSLDVSVPKDASLTLSAQTRFGSITAPDWANVTQDSGGARASGTLEQGQHALQMQTSNGNIRLVTN